RILLELVRTHVAAVLGHPGAESVPPDRAFSELGFDSLAAVELRNALTAATDLRLPATPAFDQPNSPAVAGYLGSPVAGAPAAAPGPARRTPATREAAPRPADDPIVIVGISCRFPGGVRDAEGLWRLVAEGRDAVAGFPTDRGWDVSGIYHPEPGQPGRTY